MSTDAPQKTEDLIARRGIRLGGRNLRQHAARGTIINAGFSIGIAAIAMVRGLLVARFLVSADYGVWGVLAGSLSTLWWLKDVGVGDKYQQQDDDDQELAFQHAFTAECIVSAVLLVLLVIAVPLISLAYGRSELLLPGFAMILILPANVLSAPRWVFSRQLKWGMRRTLDSVDPIVGSIAALALAIAGAGYWALIGGVLAGAWSSSLLSVRLAPYPLRLRFDKARLGIYWSFSWPLFLTSFSSLVIVQVALFFGNAVVGLAGVGAITLASNVSQFAQSVDGIVSGTMYPVVCAVNERLDLLFESFVKSNRVALIWGLPFGVGLALFAPDLVHYGVGEQWRPAIPLLVTMGLTAGFGQLAFNWDDYLRARGDTRPMAWVAGLTMLSFVATAIPLGYLWGLKGFAVAIAVQTVVNIAGRMYYLRRLFSGFRILKHVARACAPVVPPVALVLGMRLLEPRDRHFIDVIGELTVYALVYVGVTWLFERRLLTEMFSYVFGSKRHASAGAPVGDARVAASGALGQ